MTNQELTFKQAAKLLKIAVKTGAIARIEWAGGVIELSGEILLAKPSVNKQSSGAQENIEPASPSNIFDGRDGYWIRGDSLDNCLGEPSRKDDGWIERTDAEIAEGKLPEGVGCGLFWGECGGATITHYKRGKFRFKNTR